MIQKADLWQYVGWAVDDTLNPRDPGEAPSNARLVAWQCGFEPAVVAVWSYLDNELETWVAEEIAMDYLLEIGWLDDEDDREPDYVM